MRQAYHLYLEDQVQLATTIEREPADLQALYVNRYLLLWDYRENNILNELSLHCY